MRKIIAALIIAFSVGLLASSCANSQSTPSPIATPMLQQTVIPTQLFDPPTPEITPTLNNTPDENGGLIITLGRPSYRQGYWLAIPAFSPDGKMIALVSGRVGLWDTETHELIYELEKPYSNCYTENVAFSLDGKLLAASIDCYENATGYVLIWDTESGVLLHNWEQAFSKDTSEFDELFNSRPATGIAFLSASSVLAFANGNTIEIRDVKEDSEPIVFELGDEMFASDIVISQDGKRLFAFMDFSYTKTANEVGQKYALQTWDLNSNKIVEQVDFPEPDNTGIFFGHFDVEMKLTGRNLINIDYINETFTVTDVETGTKTNLDYLGDVETYLSQDSKYVIYLPKLDGFNCKNQSIELLDTHLNQNLYTFETSNKYFGRQWCYGPHTIIFNPNNTILAITHEERVSLLDISSFTKSKENGVP